ncbi:MAG: hypothetical protein ABW137_01640 [Mycobacterium sp.]
MKILVLTNEDGDVQSVAVPNPTLPGRLHVEVDGGAAARELDVDDTEIQRDDLLGHRGAQALERALQKLRKLVS